MKRWQEKEKLYADCGCLCKFIFLPKYLNDIG